MRITYNKEQLASIKHRIAKQLDLIKGDKSKIMAKISVQMYKSVMQNFKEQGTDKQKWQPLSPLTLFIRQNRISKPNKKPLILQDTGYLRQSIYPNFSENEAVVGTNVKYARLQQYGGVSEPSTVKVRRVLPRQYKGKPISPQTLAKRHNRKYSVIYDMYIKSHKVPARPFLHLRQDTLENIKKQAILWFSEGKI